MAFRLSGTISGHPATATWEHGHISSDHATEAELHLLIDSTTIVLAPVPARFPAAHSPGWLALATLVIPFLPRSKTERAPPATTLVQRPSRNGLLETSAPGCSLRSSDGYARRRRLLIEPWRSARHASRSARTDPHWSARVRE